MAQKLQRDAEHNLQSFGQGGFDILETTGGDSASARTFEGDWVAISAVDGNKVKCTLYTTTGDDYSTDGAGAAGINIVSGQTIYGDFYKVKIADPGGSLKRYLIAYRRVV